MKPMQAFAVFLMIFFWLAPASRALIDPAIPSNTVLIYQIEEAKREFEYHTHINIIQTKEGEAYLVTTFIPGTSLESGKSQTIYEKNSLLPAHYTCSYQDLAHDFYFYKLIRWDWEKKECNFEEICSEKGKTDNKKYNKQWSDAPYFDLPLIYSGLLNSLPLDKNYRTASLNLLVGTFSVKVDFKLITEEVVAAAGTSWECYKVEATPNLGFAFNWLKIFVGDPKSYVWLTSAKPKIIPKAFINLPWAKRNVTLKKYFMPLLSFKQKKDI